MRIGLELFARSHIYTISSNVLPTALYETVCLYIYISLFTYLFI